MFGKDETNNIDFLEAGEKQSMTGKIKSDFISKVYTLLSIQLVATWLMSYTFYIYPSITEFVLRQTGLLITTILFTFLFLFLSWCYGKTHPWNYIILAGFTLCEAYSVSYVWLVLSTDKYTISMGFNSIYIHWT